MTEQARTCASIIFDYHQLGHKPALSDAMLVLGTNDTRVANHAADLFHQGLAPLIVITGGIAHQQDLLSTNWNRPEAEVFAEIMLDRGVPSKAILLETQATNTAENIRFARKLFERYTLSRILIVTKPFMQRRAYATHAVEWPEMPAIMSSWSSTFEDYCTHPDLDPVKVANIVMGDLQRLWIYSSLGYSAPQRIPEEVMTAFHTLAALGFDRHLIPAS